MSQLPVSGVVACHMHSPAAVDSPADTMVVNPPAGAAWELGAFRLLAESRSAGGQGGGDFYAFRLRGAKRLSIVIGDACGRGQEGARLLPNVLPRLEELSGSATAPSQLLEGLNRLLARTMASDRFITGSAFELDAEQGTLTVANAGHVPALLRSSGGGVTVVGRASGPPLGILPDSSYLDECYRLGQGDVLVFMTDGILEAVETDLAEMPELTALLAEAGDGSRGVHRRLLAKLAGYPPERRTDDMTLLSLEILADAAAPERLEREQAI